MTSYTTFVSAAVYLALNLVILGAVIAVATAAAFKLLPATLPRARYLVAIAAFCAASTLPIIATLGLSAGSKATSPPPAQAQDIGLTPDNATTTEEVAVSIQAATPPSITLMARRMARGAMAHVFFWLWLAISALLALRELAGHISMLRARRRWSHATNAQRLALNWPDSVSLYLGHQVGPSAIGWLRPAVAAPLWLFDDLSPAAARRIARHELAHVKWRDPMVNALLRLALALLWPGLPLWFLERLARVEREAAADRAALAGDATEMKQAALDYADSLVSIAEMERIGASSRSFRMIATHAAGRRTLEIRVSRLLQEAPHIAPIRLALGLIALSGGLAGAIRLPAVVADHGQESSEARTKVMAPASTASAPIPKAAEAKAREPIPRRSKARLPRLKASAAVSDRRQESTSQVGGLPSRIVFDPSGATTLIRKTADGEVEEPILRRSEAELKASAVERLTPSFTEEPTNNSRSTAVMVMVLIDESGKVISARAMAGSRNPSAEQKAVAAARRWRFTPATMNGKPTKVISKLTFFGQLDWSKGWIEIR